MFDQYEVVLLVSILNTKLRDYFKSLDSLVDDFGWSLIDLVTYLDKKGYSYSSKTNQIRQK